jgi:hypothetical protein
LGPHRGHQDPDIGVYRDYLSQPEAAQKIMRDLRRFLLGAFASASAPDDGVTHYYPRRALAAALSTSLSAASRSRLAAGQTAFVS